MTDVRGHKHTAKAKRMVKHIEDSDKERYGERAEEVAWRVVHSELTKGEREKRTDVDRRV